MILICSEAPGVLASSFASILEMVREGAIEVQQTQAFAPIFLRKRPGEKPPIHLVSS